MEKLHEFEMIYPKWGKGRSSHLSHPYVRTRNSIYTPNAKSSNLFVLISRKGLEAVNVLVNFGQNILFRSVYGNKPFQEQIISLI